MDPRMIDWISTGERPAPLGVISFAKSASGSSKRRNDDEDDGEDDDDEDDEDEDEEDDDEDDDLADLSDEELRAELKKAKASLSKAGGSVASKRKKIRTLQRELDEEKRKPKAATKKKSSDDDDDEAPDLDLIRAEARKEGIDRAKKSEARAALIAAGVSRERVTRAVGMLDLEELDLDDEGLDGIDEAIDALKEDVPELFATKRRRRGSVAGKGDRDGDEVRSKSKLTPSQRQAAAATGKR